MVTIWTPPSRSVSTVHCLFAQYMIWSLNNQQVHMHFVHKVRGHLCSQPCGFIPWLRSAVGLESHVCRSLGGRLVQHGLSCYSSTCLLQASEGLYNGGRVLREGENAHNWHQIILASSPVLNFVLLHGLEGLHILGHRCLLPRIWSWKERRCQNSNLWGSLHVPQCLWGYFQYQFS